MATPTLLPFDELLEPLPGDEPAGDTVPFTVRQQLEDFRKEINPDDFPEDDPMRPTEIKKADWKAIIALTQQTLKETSKDLLIAARLTEAMAKEHGFGGLRDGLRLMRRMVDECWERIHPDIDDGDLEVRAAPFNWLDDPDRGARFPTSLRMTPIVRDEDEGFGWYHWKQIQEGNGKFAVEDFERAVAAAPREQCQDVVDDLEAVKQEMRELGDILSGKLGDDAPSLIQMQQAVTECEQLAQQILRRKGPAPSEMVEEEAEEETSAAEENGAAVAEAPRKKARTREEVYRQLREAAALLQQIEPHSPVPYLIQKCVELGSLPFPQLMRALIRDEGVIMEMNRELGIKDETVHTEEE